MFIYDRTKIENGTVIFNGDRNLPLDRVFSGLKALPILTNPNCH
jgi:hypothetical protein